MSVGRSQPMVGAACLWRTAMAGDFRRAHAWWLLVIAVSILVVVMVWRLAQDEGTPGLVDSIEGGPERSVVSREWEVGGGPVVTKPFVSSSQRSDGGRAEAGLEVHVVSPGGLPVPGALIEAWLGEQAVVV